MAETIEMARDEQQQDSAQPQKTEQHEEEPRVTEQHPGQEPHDAGQHAQEGADSAVPKTEDRSEDVGTGTPADAKERFLEIEDLLLLLQAENVKLKELVGKEPLTRAAREDNMLASAQEKLSAWESRAADMQAPLHNDLKALAGRMAPLEEAAKKNEKLAAELEKCRADIAANMRNYLESHDRLREFRKAVEERLAVFESLVEEARYLVKEKSAVLELSKGVELNAEKAKTYLEKIRTTNERVDSELSSIAKYRTSVDARMGSMEKAAADYRNAVEERLAAVQSAAARSTQEARAQQNAAAEAADKRMKSIEEAIATMSIAMRQQPQELKGLTALVDDTRSKLATTERQHLERAERQMEELKGLTALVDDTRSKLATTERQLQELKGLTALVDDTRSKLATTERQLQELKGLTALVDDTRSKLAT
ncbi:MAG: hypothetical protein HYY37_03910 [Candidatus Aenigmarchaeota archaeon]|nr:hypothetical protein [Candidatus Aenigmarchaeota archaeon]